MVMAEPATQADLEKRTRLLAVVLCGLGGLAFSHPLAGSSAESRVGLLLVLAARSPRSITGFGVRAPRAARRRGKVARSRS